MSLCEPPNMMLRNHTDTVSGTFSLIHLSSRDYLKEGSSELPPTTPEELFNLRLEGYRIRVKSFRALYGPKYLIHIVPTPDSQNNRHSQKRSGSVECCIGLLKAKFAPLRYGMCTPRVFPFSSGSPRFTLVLYCPNRSHWYHSEHQGQSVRLRSLVQPHSLP